jgi:hypothetical protein
VQSSPNGLTAYWPILFLALGVTLMGFIGFLNSVISGWYSLSKRFHAQSEPYGDTRIAGPFFYTVYMRYWAHYSCIIRMIAAEDALYLSAHFGFRIGHPPLSIPWREIRLSRTNRFWRRYVVLTLGDQEKIPMRISERMARNLGILERLANLESALLGAARL